MPRNLLSINKDKIDDFVVSFDSRKKLINIQYEDNRDLFFFHFFSIDGKYIFSKQITDVSTSIPVILLNGLYIYKITGNGLAQSGKIIVKQ